MNLVIDIGNSFVKYAVFDGRVLQYKETTQLTCLLKSIDAIGNKVGSIENAILSSVIPLENTKADAIRQRCSLMVLDATTPLPFKNGYASPETLGTDRIALACAAVEQFPGQNALVIGMGTCVTFDIVTSKRLYLGGSISPGLRMRYTALHQLTARLPLLEVTMPKTLVGCTTNDAIHAGVVYGMLKEVEGIIEMHQEKHKQIVTVVTGGDSRFLSRKLKTPVIVRPHFLLEGLNGILELQLEKNR